MLKRFRETIRSEQSLAPEVRLQLVDGLFYPLSSLIAGAVAGIWIAATVTLLVDNWLLRGIADFAVLVGLARILISLRYVTRRQPATSENYFFWQMAYAVGGGAFAATLGLLCLFSLLMVDSSPLHLMLTTTTAGYAAGITGRNAGRPWVAISQLYLAAGPMCLGLMLHPGSFYQIVGVALFVFMFGMTDITLSVRKTIVAALETKQDNMALARSFEKQANLFDDALNNMSHGLCMFDKAGHLLVWNRKLSEILGCQAEVLEAGLSIAQILARLKSVGEGEARDDQLVQAISQIFSSRDGRQVFVRLNDEKVIALARQQMENGNVVMVFEDVTEQTKANERIQQLAWTDELTGLMNRASFREVFKKTLDVGSDDMAIALHLIDLDHFKSVNDTLGHPIGDLLLVEVSRRIAEVCHDQGHVARLGGDEFVIIQKLLPQSLSAGDLALRVIERLCAPFEISSNRINIGASIGIVLAPQNGRHVDVLLKRADMALYEAKAKGRNCLQFFETNLDQQLQQRRELELDIRTAIEQNQFTLAFQPITDVVNGRISAFETLIRWHHPTRGFVSPAEFIPIAEETGLIIEIGRWVVEEACRLASGWPTRASIAVNFSAVQFQDKQFPLFLVSVLDKHGLPPQRLELEITETALLHNNTGTIDMLEQLRAIGVHISLDDFGTGYSSLSQLRTFPFNKIKIDGSFVRDLGRDASSVAVIRAVINIGKILGMTVVAECVENEEQLQFLVSAGCDELQGYLLGKPQEASGIPKLLANEQPDVVRRYAIA
jgi:diguanylate cyclase (GGDEF)-like protein/PAS domain S-box-containing protein